MPDFVSRTPNRGLTRLGMEQQANSTLLNEAFSLNPDADAVTKAIMDKKLYSADVQQPMNEVNSIVSDYMTRFNKDPFYAFSKEGRKAAQTLKSIVNHPALKEWEQNTQAAEDQYKQASANRLNKNIVVQGNDVLAFKDGKRQYISINELNSLDPKKGDRLLDVDSDMKGIRNVWGVRDGGPSYDMSKIDDIDQKINSALSGLGSEETEGLVLGSPQEGADMRMRRKSNELQLKTAIRTLATTGLTESDRNTLRSEYIKSAGTSASSQGFNQWLSDKLSGIASGKLSTVRSDVPQKGLKLDIEATRAGMDKKNPPLTAASLILNGVTGTRKVDQMVGGVGQSLQGNLLPPQETLNNSSGSFKDELGNSFANRTVKNLKVFSDATDLKNLSVLDRTGKGTWSKLPGLAQYGVVVDRPGAEPALVYQYSYRDDNGEPTPVPVRITKEILDRQNAGQPLPASLQRYVTTMPLEEAVAKVTQSSMLPADKQRQILSLQSQVTTDGNVKYLDKTPWVDFSVVVPNKKGMFSKIPGEARALGDEVERLGYSSTESEQMRDYHKKYSGAGDITDAPDTMFGIDDEFYEVKAQVPLTSFEQLNSAYGGHSIGNREDIYIDTSRLRDNYELLSPNLFQSGTVPNMTRPRARVTIDDIN